MPTNYEYLVYEIKSLFQFNTIKQVFNTYCIVKSKMLTKVKSRLLKLQKLDEKVIIANDKVSLYISHIIVPSFAYAYCL